MRMLPAFALALFALAASSQPAVSTITPAAGLVTGGEYVHLHGEDLRLVPVPCTPPCALVVTFGDAEAAVVSDSDDEILVIAPPHGAGSVDVKVALAVKGTITIPHAYRYEDPLPSDHVRFLVPVALNAPGALGSNWVSELLIHNGSAEPVTIASTTIAPHTTEPVTLPNVNVGAFFSVPQRLAQFVTANLRVHDTAYDDTSWGTDIPVVPETQFRPLVVLGGIPASSRFRTLLRVYTYNRTFAEALAAVRDDATGALLTTLAFHLVGGETTPAYAQVALDPVVALYADAHPRIRVEVAAQPAGAPIAPPVPLWGFVAVTNNTTQQVTTVTPSLIPSTDPPPALARGHWAGGGTCVDVSTVGVEVVMVCSVAHFPLPLAVSNNHFETDGTYAFTAGPVRPDSEVPAHFSGAIDGNQLRLTISPVNTSPPFTVQVTYGSDEPCPQLCR